MHVLHMYTHTHTHTTHTFANRQAGSERHRDKGIGWGQRGGGLEQRGGGAGRWALGKEVEALCLPPTLPSLPPPRLLNSHPCLLNSHPSLHLASSTHILRMPPPQLSEDAHVRQDSDVRQDGGHTASKATCCAHPSLPHPLLTRSSPCLLILL